MRRLLVILVGVFWSLALAAADLLQCVHPDVANGLLFIVPNDGKLSITDEMPAAIAALSKPDGLGWIAASERSSNTVGAFTAGGDTDAVLAAAVAALADDGWAPDGMGGIASAFETAAQERSQTLCREGAAMSIATRNVDGTTYLIYNLPRSSERSACRLRSQDFARTAAADSPMPSFDFAALGSTARQPMRSGGFAGITAGSSTELRLDAELAQVVEELTRQLSAQGWRLDTSWSGAVMAGSTWTQSDAEHRYAGTLDVLSRGGSRFAVDFELTELQ